MFCKEQFEIKHFSQVDDQTIVLAWEKIVGGKVDFIGIKIIEKFREKLLDMQWIYFGFYKNELIGMFSVTHFEHEKCGRVHFWIFPQGKRVMISGSRHCLLWLFEECGFETLIMWTPAGFTMGCALAQRLGAIIIGVIPKAIQTHRGTEDVITGYFTRESVIMGLGPESIIPNIIMAKKAPKPPAVQPAPKMPDPKATAIDETNKDVRDARTNARRAEVGKFNQADTLLAGSLQSDPNAVGKKKLLGG